MMMIPRRRNEFDLFDEMFNDPFFTRSENKLMKTDIKEKKDHYELEVDLPGYEKEDIKIELEDGYLTITAEKKEQEDEENKNYICHERRYGKYERSFYLGDLKTDDISAKFENGILKVRVPKVEESENKKLIEIE